MFCQLLKHPVCPRNVDDILKAEKQRDIHKDYVTLSSFINDVERTKPVTSYQFPQLMNAIQTACKSISILLKKSGISQLQAMGLDKGPKMADTKKMERYFNEIFIDLVGNSCTTCLIACKDSDDLIKVDLERAGKYIVVFSAIDVSANIDSSLCVGTTFAVFRKKGGSKVDDKDVLQMGHRILAGGYTMYGLATTMVISFEGSSVNGFTLDNSIGEFILTDENMRIPTSGKSYCTNEGNTHFWDSSIADYLEKKKTLKIGSPWSARYTGSLVSDVHTTLKYGGLYLYPSCKEFPNGKHRLIHECNPLAFIIVHAGGMATNGRTAIGDIHPEKVTEKTPFFCGSPDDMEELMNAIVTDR